MLTADPLFVGAVYIEEDSGADLHGDTFEITFTGGADGTELTRLVIDGDHAEPGFGLTDVFFDTAPGGLGADESFPFTIVSLDTQDPSASVRATVVDGGTKLVLDFSRFRAGDRLVFSIDVDEAQQFDPTTTDPDELNEGFDPITSGVEFQGSHLTASFRAPHYHDVSGTGEFRNRYDENLEGTGLELPRDNERGNRDRTAGGVAELVQVPLPVVISGTVFHDRNLNLRQDAGDEGLAGVSLSLWRKDASGQYVQAVGPGGQPATAVTNAQGDYVFGEQWNLLPGVYQVRQTQPNGFPISVGAIAGTVEGTPSGAAAGDNVITEIAIPLGGTAGVNYDFAEALPASLAGRVYHDRNNDGVQQASESGIAGVTVRLLDASGAQTAVATTNSQGDYLFSNLRPGSYAVVETQPGGWIDGKETLGRVAGTTTGQIASAGDRFEQIVLRSGEAGADYLFGERLGSLEGFVHADPDGDCIFDAGEAPLAGVTITLVDAGGRETTAVTDSSGRYRFSDLQAGQYTIRQTQPAGWFTAGQVVGTGTGDASTPNVISGITIGGSHVHLANYNFCEARGSLSGYVYHDRDNDGIRDSGEEAISGVELRLLDEQGRPVTGDDGQERRATTDSSGFYRFENLGPGVYRIVESHPQGWIDGKDSIGQVGGTSVGQAIAPDTLSEIRLQETSLGGAGIHGVNYNFGERRGSLEGVVHADADGDCVFDDDETPLAGVRITLTNDRGQQWTTTTDAAGRYRFTDLAAGVYTVTEEQPGGWFSSGQTAGNGGGDASVTNVISQIRIDENHVQLTGYDFCEALGSLSGYVYHDRDDDGLREAGEEGIAGVVVRLRDSEGRPVLDAGGQERSAITDANGYYRFLDLAPGNYRLVQEHPTGWLDGQDTPGRIGEQPVGRPAPPDAIVDIDYTGGLNGEHPGAGVEYNFGELKPGGIEGLVHVDRDEDCVYDEDEPPLAGVTITLLDQEGNSWTTVTDDQGRYRFENLRPGTYRLVESQPSGYFNVGQVPGSGGGDGSTPNVISQIVLPSGGAKLTGYHFCESLGSLSGYVYHDRDDDGLRDEGEEGIAGVAIELRDQQGSPVLDSSGQPRMAVTDSSGFYRFDDLPAGVYRIVERHPQSWLDGKDTPGEVNGRPSGVAVAPDTIGDVSLLPLEGLGPSQHGANYNFGELRPGSISGVIHADVIANCVFDEGESPLEGVTVELLNDQGQVIATTTTDAQGRYEFLSLAPGVYSVRELQPTGYFHQGQTAGSGGGDDSQADLISGIALASGAELVHYDFCDAPPGSISGYVFQDGPPLTTEDGTPPEDLHLVRDGQLTEDDRRLGGVVLELRDGLTGAPILADEALPGAYAGGPIRVTTDASGFYQFAGLRGGRSYAVYEVHPAGYFDGIDTPGSTSGMAVNRHAPLSPAVLGLLTVDPRDDAIVRIPLASGAHSQHNNFSEVVAVRPPPLAPPRPDLPEPPPVRPEPQAVFIPPAAPRALFFGSPPPTPRPDLISGGAADYSWHLSIVDGGLPRQAGEEDGDDARRRWQAAHIQLQDWNSPSLDAGWWRIDIGGDKSPNARKVQELCFGMPGAIPIAGDFDGDGVDEVGVFHEGQWYLDLNGNGRWDEADLWARLGHKTDLPVVGDWNGDGKDDIGIYGPEWANDARAIRRDGGLPDPANQNEVRRKNAPPAPEEATSGVRLLRRTAEGRARADLIDHVFRYGVGEDLPVVGDWNGDGVSTIGVFRSGAWLLDADADGRQSKTDRSAKFGQAGDIPVVGDFNGDGVEELGVYRAGRWIIDTNHNGEIDAADQVFELGGAEDFPIVGDWDGDGVDEPGLYRGDSQPASGRKAG